MKNQANTIANREYARRVDGVGTDTDESFFYGYKEPLRKYELGFGYRGVLIYSKNKDKVQCHLCGKFFRFINAKHLRLHEHTAATYKQEVGLSSSTALIGEGVRQRLIEQCVFTREDVMQKRQVAHNASDKAKHPEQPKISLEARNKLGTCPDQLLDKIKQLSIMDKNVPTVREFKEAYGNKFLWSIIRMFGSWSKASEMCGMQPHQMRYSEERLLEYLRLFKQQNGRNPSSSDFRRGILPSRMAYRNRFGSVLNAILKVEDSNSTGT